jgi:8-oxo-dGTP pyrophosphatase MutT (NUDIX family)
MIEYVVGFAKDKENFVLMVVKKKPTWQEGLLNGIGGKVEEGETPLEAMHREWTEETGLSTQNWKQFANLGRTDWVVHFFYALSEDDFIIEGGKRCIDDLPWRNDIGEIIFPFFYPNDLVHPILKTISNIKYLMPLAFEQTKNNNKFDILEIINASSGHD